jgi:glycosyltransferase involved in cell wall biosynthesis
VVHSGIDLDRIVSREPVPLEQREHFALTVGHTYSHKNYEAMVDAIDAYRTRFDPPLRLRIVGGAANPQYFEAIKQRIERLGLGDLIEMMGPAPSEEVLSLMSRAKVYLVTSLLETFGLTMFEAMGQGLPVVASRATCHPEVCGDAALYCDPRSPADIAEKLHQLISSPEIGTRLRDQGYRRLEGFSWNHSAKGYLDVLEEATRGA